MVYFCDVSSWSSSFCGILLLSCRVASSLESLRVHLRIPTQALQITRRTIGRAGYYDRQTKGRALSQDNYRRSARRKWRSLCAGNSMNNEQPMSCNCVLYCQVRATTRFAEGMWSEPVPLSKFHYHHDDCTITVIISDCSQPLVPNCPVCPTLPPPLCPTCPATPTCPWLIAKNKQVALIAEFIY